MKEEGGGERVKEEGGGGWVGGDGPIFNVTQSPSSQMTIKAGSDVPRLCRFAGSSGQGLL